MEKKRLLKAKKEVILSAGSIGSPQLLQLSGIGPKQVLSNAGVELVHELPGVGENLQDHLEVYFQYHCKKPITLNSKLNLFSKGLIGVQWILAKQDWAPQTILSLVVLFDLEPVSSGQIFNITFSQLQCATMEMLQ
jgi:choline dehydrogenase-like flavoprotein